MGLSLHNFGDEGLPSLGYNPQMYLCGIQIDQLKTFHDLNCKLTSNDFTILFKILTYKYLRSAGRTEKQENSHPLLFLLIVNYRTAFFKFQLNLFRDVSHTSRHKKVRKGRFFVTPAVNFNLKSSCFQTQNKYL